MGKTLRNILAAGIVLASGTGLYIVNMPGEREGYEKIEKESEHSGFKIHRGVIALNSKARIDVPELGGGYYLKLCLDNRIGSNVHSWFSFRGYIFTSNNNLVGYFGSEMLRSDDTFVYESQNITIKTSFRNKGEEKLEYNVKVMRDNY